jgi:hypothetical protein
MIAGEGSSFTSSIGKSRHCGVARKLKRLRSKEIGTPCDLRSAVWPPQAAE